MEVGSCYSKGIKFPFIMNKMNASEHILVHKMFATQYLD